MGRERGAGSNRREGPHVKPKMKTKHHELRPPTRRVSGSGGLVVAFAALTFSAYTAPGDSGPPHDPPAVTVCAEIPAA